MKFNNVKIYNNGNGAYYHREFMSVFPTVYGIDIVVEIYNSHIYNNVNGLAAIHLYFDHYAASAAVIVKNTIFENNIENPDGQLWIGGRPNTVEIENTTFTNVHSDPYFGTQLYLGIDAGAPNILIKDSSFIGGTSHSPGMWR